MWSLLYNSRSSIHLEANTRNVKIYNSIIAYAPDKEYSHINPISILINITHLSMGSVFSFSNTVVYGTPRTLSIMCTKPLVAAIFGCVTVALTPPPSTVRVWLCPCWSTLKYKYLRSKAVGAWYIYKSFTRQNHKPEHLITPLFKRSVLIKTYYY